MSLENLLRRLYISLLRPIFLKPIQPQRLKMFWFCWKYWPLLFIKSLPVQERFVCIYRFLLIDWSIEHAHRPAEIIEVVQFIAERPVNKDEIVLEAGCWKGGSTAKFSIFCNFFGYKLHAYDSFAGVESTQEGCYDFSGEYSAREDEVKDNLLQYGNQEVCIMHRGWFFETLNPISLNSRICTAYIDCDLAKGTEEVLKGVLPWLADASVVFTQDYHILSVKQLLHNPVTWEKFAVSQPIIRPLCHNLAL